MPKRLDQFLGESAYDALINNTSPTADVFSIKLRAGQGELPRGAALALTDKEAGDMVLLGTAPADGEALTANCVLCDPVDTGDSAGEGVYAIAYRTGHLNRNHLILAEGYTLTAQDEEDLRKGGILLSDAL